MGLLKLSSPFFLQGFCPRDDFNEAHGRASGAYMLKVSRAKGCLNDFGKCCRGALLETGSQDWETDFYTPPVPGGATLCEISAPVV